MEGHLGFTRPRDRNKHNLCTIYTIEQFQTLTVRFLREKKHLENILQRHDTVPLHKYLKISWSILIKLEYEVR